MTSRMASRIKLALVATTILASIACSHTTAPDPPTAPSAAWDQSRVTKIAQNLSAAVDKAYEAQYKSPQTTMPSVMGGGDGSHEFMDTLRRLQHETRHLASALEKGASAGQTMGSVKHINELNDDLEEYGRKFDATNSVLNEFAGLEDNFNQLRPYYGLDR